MRNLLIMFALLFIASCGSQISQPTAPPIKVPKANFNKPKAEILVVDFRNDGSIKDMIKRQGQIVPIKFGPADKLMKIEALANCQLTQKNARKHPSWSDIEYRILGRHPTRNVWLCVPNQLNKQTMKENCNRMKMDLVGFDSKNWHTFSCKRREK